jgi:hypothetical protein
LSKANIKSTKTEMELILGYIEKSGGLTATVADDGTVQVTQDVDSKVFTFSSHSIVEILERKDSENKDFLQLNFKNSTKVLLTENLVGFKPSQTLGLDMNKLPKVVTTPDLMSVYDALEEALGSDTTEHEVEILKKVYLSIIDGGERVGFCLEPEKKWLHRLLGSRFSASA